MSLDDLLVPRHPLPRLHEQQVQALQQLPETERAEQAQLLRVGNAAYRYHQLADGHLTEADFQHWLAGLPPRMHQAMTVAGFAAANSSWAFRRHVLERRDLGYTAFMQQQLSAEDWAFLQQQDAESD
ncbi:hypothetical protein [Hymenobacter sp. UYP22]|uniref:hypothetical protein n=1 Tax=Hymenobacter sp. UYP22 TaxID=3156348 RepID=UPI003395706F